MSRHTASPNITWDLFAPTQPNDGLRSITLLAAQLAGVKTQRVRLFVDDPGRMTALSAKIDPALWVQPWQNCELMRLRLADAVAPADHVVCLGDTEIPRRYRERMAYGAESHCKLLRIWPLGHPMGALDDTAGAAPCNTLRFDVVQDEKAENMGLIKDARSTADMRARWKSHVNVNLPQTTLESLGLPGDLAKDTLIVCCWNAAIANMGVFLDTLAQACSQPVLVLFGSTAGTGTPAPTVSHGTLRCLNLPPMSWSRLDEIIWGSDLIFCGERDVALRAMESGAPVMWLPATKPAAPDDDALLNWYFAGLDPGFKRCLMASAHSLREDDSPSQELAWYLGQRDDLEMIARQVAQRISQARNLADTLPHLTGSMLEKARRRKLEQDHVHPPTWPMSLPGQPESA
ncbi:MAG: elongation factor P maturation arginine rhamnosyltransferase EarP [Hydrogenophaga sp.]|uniref:elongation factor P maturation arginine rhamnosyltransferase EarP n=1 Tax=Hydrogenophaga sp. TaxID=1904254 RepID=UPI003D09CA2D